VVALSRLSRILSVARILFQPDYCLVVISFVCGILNSFGI